MPVTSSNIKLGPWPGAAPAGRTPPGRAAARQSKGPSRPGPGPVGGPWPPPGHHGQRAALSHGGGTELGPLPGLNFNDRDHSELELEP